MSEQPTVMAPPFAVNACKWMCVHHSGRFFTATHEHAAIFLRHVQAISDRRVSELVPLLHSEGVDLLFVAANTPLRVHDVRDRSFDRDHGVITADPVLGQ